MKINQRKVENKVLFHKINSGQVFMIGDVAWMKCYREAMNTQYAVRLSDGKLEGFNSEELVNVVGNCELNIEY